MASHTDNFATSPSHPPGRKESVQSSGALNITVDVLIVGGGMSGMYAMWKLRQQGLRVHLFEEGSYFGGAWHWNRYPGARVDSETPYYGLSIPEVYRTWSYTERFPNHVELRKYFAHIDQTLDLAKDAHFNAVVSRAKFEAAHATWSVETDTGGVARCKYLIMATGSTHKPYVPEFKDMARYRRQIFHSARCPGRLDVTGKKVACIGSGASGVQIVQALARENCQLHAYIRTPNICLPLKQRMISINEQDQARNSLQSLYESAKRTKSGFHYSLAQGSIWDLTADERESFWEMLWERGGIHFLVSNFPEILTDKKANRLVYDFWARKIRARIVDPVKREILAPLRQRHWFGTKRPSLEDEYYERLQGDNVTLVDLHVNPIKEFTETGIALSDRHEDYDIIILATGYDSITGSLTNIDLTGLDGHQLRDKWAQGTSTYLGLAIDGFPNMFMIYGPHSPISFSNAPPVIEIQVDWVATIIEKMRQEGVVSLEARSDAADAWRKHLHHLSSQTLYPETKSWYMGANVPGKPWGPLCYLGGLDRYRERTSAVFDGWKGFHVVRETSG